jgi:hypothetical protein
MTQKKNWSNRTATSLAVRLRLSRKESQTAFWSRFGISQACASRIECTTQVPPSVLILLGLYLDGVISEDDLERYSPSDEE